MKFDLLESIDAMRAGRKIQTRRRDTSSFWLRKKVGTNITIVHQGKHLGMATVKAVWRQRLAAITQRQALAEGYLSKAAFLLAWEKMYPDAKASDSVTVIEFGPVRWAREQSGRRTM